jgi:hypothetical protein
MRLCFDSLVNEGNLPFLRNEEGGATGDRAAGRYTVCPGNFGVRIT